VYSRDTLGDLGSVERLLDDDGAAQDSVERQKDARTLDELRFVPGDYLCVAVMLPKNVQANFATGDAVGTKGPGGGGTSSAPANGWKSGGGGGGSGGGLGRGECVARRAGWRFWFWSWRGSWRGPLARWIGCTRSACSGSWRARRARSGTR